MDVWVAPTEPNFLRLLDAVEAFGFQLPGMREFAPRVPTEGFVFRLDDFPFVADIMSHIAGLRYEEAEPNRRFFDLDGLQLYVIHRNDLIVNKMTSGRPKDQDDVYSLQRIEAYFKGEKLEAYEKPLPPPDVE